MSAIYRREPRPPRLGKVRPGFFERVLARNLGRHRKEVLVGPGTGVDVAVVSGRGGDRWILTTDPVYIEPAFGWERAAWFAFHILASDLTTSGVAPQLVSLDLNLPPEMTDAQLASIVRGFGRECRKLGAQVVTGHTGRYDSCRFPIVGGATFLARASERAYVTTRLVRPGNKLLVTKSAALEAAVTLAYMFPTEVGARVGPGAMRRLRSFFPQLTTVPDALTAASVGLRSAGVWAMHDVTEGGVRNAIWEMAYASGTGVEVDLTRVPILPDVARVCARFGMDPLASSSEGTLLLAADPRHQHEVAARLRSRGIAATEIGTFTSASGRCLDRGRPFGPVQQDAFWPAVVRTRRASDSGSGVPSIGPTR